MGLLVKNGRVVTEDGILEESILIEDGKIIELGEIPEGPGLEVLDAEGAYVLPGGIDPHTHMELQQSERFRSADDFYTGTVAAALGGTTTIIDHIGFAPAGSSLRHSLDQYRRKAEKAVVDYSFHGVIQHVDDRILRELKELIEQEGIASFKAYSTYGFKIGDADLFRILRVMKEAGGLLTMHCENDAAISLLKEESRQAGHTAPIWHARTRPERTESEAIARLCEFSALAGNAPVYIVHTSTALGAKRIAAFRGEGIPVTMETCPQYLMLTEDKYQAGSREEGLKYIMAPPLRKEADNEALWQSLSDGTCQTIGTDHCPFLLKEKLEGMGDFSLAPGGAGGVQERIPLLFSEGVLKGRISVEQLAKLTSTNVARIMGLYPGKGTIRPGSDADLVILREGPEKIIRARTQASASDYSIYEGMAHRCRIDHVLSRGEVIVRGGEFLGQRGRGQFLPRFRNGSEAGL